MQPWLSYNIPLSTTLKILNDTAHYVVLFALKKENVPLSTWLPSELKGTFCNYVSSSHWSSIWELNLCEYHWPFGQMSVHGMHILMWFSSTSILLLGQALTQELWSTTKLSEIQTAEYLILMRQLCNDSLRWRKNISQIGIWG